MMINLISHRAHINKLNILSLLIEKKIYNSKIYNSTIEEWKGIQEQVEEVSQVKE